MSNIAPIAVIFEIEWAMVPWTFITKFHRCRTKTVAVVLRKAVLNLLAAHERYISDCANIQTRMSKGPYDCRQEVLLMSDKNCGCSNVKTAVLNVRAAHEHYMSDCAHLRTRPHFRPKVQLCQNRISCDQYFRRESAHSDRPPARPTAQWWAYYSLAKIFATRVKTDNLRWCK